MSTPNKCPRCGAKMYSTWGNATEYECNSVVESGSSKPRNGGAHLCLTRQRDALAARVKELEEAVDLLAKVSNRLCTTAGSPISGPTTPASLSADCTASYMDKTSSSDALAARIKELEAQIADYESKRDQIFASSRETWTMYKDLKDTAEWVLTILCSVDGGEFKQSPEWIEAFEKCQTALHRHCYQPDKPLTPS